MTNLEIYNGNKALLNEESNGNKPTKATSALSLSGSTLDWYRLTETSRHVLSQVVSGSIEQQLEEQKKTEPDLNRIHKLEQISLVASQLSRDAKNFKSKQRMIEIINDYSNYNFNE